MTATRRRIVTIACALAALAPPRASGAVEPLVHCLVAFGTRSPATWCDEPYRDVLTPVGLPFATAWSNGTLFVRGVASPAMRVRVEATDGVTTVGVTVTSAPSADHAHRKPAGAFNAELAVPELGRHDVEPGADPTTFAGASVLQVVATPVTAGGAHAGRSRTTTIVKHAGTARDADPPVISTVRWPPSSWRPNPTPFVEDTTISVVRGVAFDDPPEAHGRASEIARISVVIRQGDRVLWRPDPNTHRPTTVRGHWLFQLRIGDFAPNWMPGSPRYFIDIEVVDAWGNRAEITSPGIRVYPV